MIWRKKNEILLPTFGAHQPSGVAEFQEQNVFPLAIMTDRGFDLDFSSLLVADGLVVDSFAIDFINDASRPHFKEMRNSIDVLRDSGFLRVEDFSQIANDKAVEISKRVDAAVEVPDFWRPAIRNAWRSYENDVPNYISRFSSCDNKREQMNFCLLYTSPSPRDKRQSRMPSSA